ncbi:hypothetical protein JVU11DRAFT_1293 [Chiua virens]|nr:hypothetical protein JVU11DRAFT_1293 [Chiua virens]
MQSGQPASVVAFKSCPATLRSIYAFSRSLPLPTSPIQLAQSNTLKSITPTSSHHHGYKHVQSSLHDAAAATKLTSVDSIPIHGGHAKAVQFDGSGSIDRDEFLQIPQIASNPLASRMIAIFDEDGGGTVDFQEFVLTSALQLRSRCTMSIADGFISNGELFLVLKMMVGNNLKDQQLQQIVDKTIMEGDHDRDGKLSFEEFAQMVSNTDIVKQMTLEDLF